MRKLEATMKEKQEQHIKFKRIKTHIQENESITQIVDQFTCK